MPIEIRELVIRASVESEQRSQRDPADVQPPARKREQELEALKKLIEQKNER